MRDIVTFIFEDRPVRSVVAGAETWWMAKDIATILDYENTKKAVSDHCRNQMTWDALADRLGIEIREGRGNESLPLPDWAADLQPHSLFIPLGDVARLIARCRLPIGDRMDRWLFDEVVPQIFATGRYDPGGKLDWDLINDKLGLVKQARLTYGRKAAQELWERLGLPAIGEDNQRVVRPDGLLQHIMDFLDELVVEDASSEVQGAELHRLYLRWAGRNHAPHFMASVFGRLVLQSGRMRRRKSNGVSVYAGIRIKAEEAKAYR